MKSIGILRVRDEADLLPAVLDNVSPSLDKIYAYDDNSLDDTLKILKSHPKVEVVPYRKDFTREVQKTQLLEQTVKHHYPYQKEDIWVALLAGDLFWLNKSPGEAAEWANTNGYDLQQGVALNFCRWKWEEGTDTWPNWHVNLRQHCRWCKFVEKLPVVWKVTNYTAYERLPWPRHFKNRYNAFDKNTPVLEHQGKRSPKSVSWRYSTRGHKKFEDINHAYEFGKSKGWWENVETIPWIGLQTIDKILEIEKMTFEERHALYASYDRDNYVFPPREDI